MKQTHLVKLHDDGIGNFSLPSDKADMFLSIRKNSGSHAAWDYYRSVQKGQVSDYNREARKLSGELEAIKKVHLDALNKLALEKFVGVITDTDRVNEFQLQLLHPEPLNHRHLLGSSKQFKLMQKLDPDLLAEYWEVYQQISSISIPDFTIKAASQRIDLESQKEQFLPYKFLTKTHHYFDYPEGAENLSSQSEIVCKASIIQIVDNLADRIMYLQDQMVILSDIADRHIAEVNSLILEKLEGLIDDVDIGQLLANQSSAKLTEEEQLGQSQQFTNILELLPKLLRNYNQIYKDIYSDKFYDLNYRMGVFEYPDGTYGEQPDSVIVCKQRLIDFANDLAAEIYHIKHPQQDEKKEIDNQDNPPQNEDDLMAMIQQLRADIEREREENLRKDDLIEHQAHQIEHQAEQIIDLNERLDQSESNNAELTQKLEQSEKHNQELVQHNQELRQDKSDLRDTVLILKEYNSEKATKLKQSEEIIAKQKSEYDLLKDQFDSIVGLGVQQEDEGSKLSGASGNLSIGSFELIGDQ